MKHHHKRLTGPARLLIAASLTTQAAAFGADKAQPDLAHAWATVHSSSQNKQCQAQIRSELARSPSSAEWLELAAVAFPGREAVAPAQKALTLSPRDGRIAAACALIAYRNGKLTEAEKMADKATQLAPKSGFAWAILAKCRGDMRDNETDALFAKAIAMSPSDYVVELFAAQYYEQIENDTEAEACLRRLIQSHPNAAEPIVMMAKFKRRNDDFEAALTYFDRAIKLEPGDRAAIAARAKMLEQMGQTQRASKEIKHWVAIAPDSAAAWYQEAKVLAKNGESAKAVEGFDKAIKLANAPQPPDRYLKTAKTLESRAYKNSWIKRMQLLVTLGQLDRALTQANAMLAADPDSDSVLETRAKILMKKGRYKDAARDFSQLIALDTDVSDWYRARAEAYKKLNQSRLADADNQKADHIDQYGF
jgi:tetratricopeptide (TPR) repeat protein